MVIVSNDSHSEMNNLIGMCFNANAIIDNLAYSLDYHFYTNIADIVHHNVAHVMPQWADLISDKMLQLGIRPVRKDINGYEKDYDNLKDVFDTILKTMIEIREATRSLIETADINGDDEVRIFSESFLENVIVFIKQSNEWVNACSSMDPITLNIHIKDYTHFISLE